MNKRFFFIFDFKKISFVKLVEIANFKLIYSQFFITTSLLTFILSSYNYYMVWFNLNIFFVKGLFSGQSRFKYGIKCEVSDSESISQLYYLLYHYVSQMHLLFTVENRVSCLNSFVLQMLFRKFLFIYVNKSPSLFFVF